MGVTVIGIKMLLNDVKSCGGIWIIKLINFKCWSVLILVLRLLLVVKCFLKYQTCPVDVKIILFKSGNQRVMLHAGWSIYWIWYIKGDIADDYF